jgi:undecaprenyl pyrophosphate synthase
MNLNEAKQLLNNNGYVLDEGIGNFAKKARRAIFGKNKDDEAILAKRQKRLAQKAEEHRQHDAQWEKRQNMWDDVTSECFRYLQKKIKNDDEGISGIYEVLVKLRKKYGKRIFMSIAGATYSQAIDIGVILKDIHHADDGGYGYGYDTVGIGRIGFYSNDNRHFDDFAGYKMEYANSYKEALDHKYVQTKDLNEWYNEIDDIANEVLNNIKKADVNDWEQNIDQNESVKVKQAVNILKENGYIVEGHWYDSTTGFRRYREDSDERETRYYNILADEFKELKDADEAQDKDSIRHVLGTIETFIGRIGNAISSSDKKGKAKDGLAKMKKYFQDKGQDDLAALVDKYAEAVLKLIW